MPSACIRCLTQELNHRANILHSGPGFKTPKQWSRKGRFMCFFKKCIQFTRSDLLTPIKISFKPLGNDQLTIIKVWTGYFGFNSSILWLKITSTTSFRWPTQSNVHFLGQKFTAIAGIRVVTSQLSKLVRVLTGDRNQNAPSDSEIKPTVGIRNGRTKSWATPQIKKRLFTSKPLRKRYKATLSITDRSSANGEKLKISKCLKEFPQFFPGNDKANLQKTSSWWSRRTDAISSKSLSKRIGSFSDTSARRGARSSELTAVSCRGQMQ